MSESNTLKKLNLGCGTHPLPGFVNLDMVSRPGIDVVFDLDACGDMNLMPFESNSFDRMLMHHVFEHIRRPIPLMNELYRIAKPGCELVIVTPYGSSDNAWEDPTHVRPIFKNTYMYYNPLAYGNADYGVTCDWSYKRREFRLDKTAFDSDADEMQIGMAVANLRNVVVEFVAVLHAVKPARQRVEGVQQDEVTTSFKFV